MLDTSHHRLTLILGSTSFLWLILTRISFSTHTLTSMSLLKGLPFFTSPFGSVQGTRCRTTAHVLRSRQELVR